MLRGASTEMPRARSRRPRWRPGRFRPILTRRTPARAFAAPPTPDSILLGMAQNSAIEWTDDTFNPWWGCAKVSAGCEHCYAEAFAKRFGHKVWGKHAGRRRFGDAHWDKPRLWNRDAEAAGTRRRVFCASMADVFDENGPPEDRRRLWALIEDTPRLDWLLLTKRPHLAADTLPSAWLDTPKPNVWLGTSVESMEVLDRIEELRQVPAALRFLSIEPLLGELRDLPLEGIGWVIVGGESGSKARPMSADWVRRIRDECVDAGIPFFFKQWGGRFNKENGRLLDGRVWDEIPVVIEGRSEPWRRAVTP